MRTNIADLVLHFSVLHFQRTQTLAYESEGAEGASAPSRANNFRAAAWASSQWTDDRPEMLMTQDVVAKDKLKKKRKIIISCTVWYQTKPVPDLQDGRAIKASFWNRFIYGAGFWPIVSWDIVAALLYGEPNSA